LLMNTNFKLCLRKTGRFILLRNLTRRFEANKCTQIHEFLPHDLRYETNWQKCFYYVIYFNHDGKNTLITQRILFEQKKCFMGKIISERIVKNANISFLSVRKSYFIGIQGFKFYTMLFRPVLIGLGVWYFDTMCATVYCFVHYQSHFGQILELTGFYSTVTIYR